VHFKFVSPLHDAIERKDAAVFLESAELIATAMEMDPSSLPNYDVGGALRDALAGVGNKTKNIRPLEQVQQINQANAEQAAAEEEAELAKTAGGAMASMATAQSKVA
jgi:hypothetical protein